MKHFPCSLRSPLAGLALLLGTALGATAGEPIATTTDKDVAVPEEPAWTFSSEINAGYTYVGGGSTDRKNIDEQSAYAQYVLTARYKEGIPVRLGVAAQRFSFSSVAGSRVPNTLQGEYLIAGFDFGIGDNIFGRIEAQPGWYSGSARVLGDSFNVPIVFGATYLFSKDFQVVVGGLVDPVRKYSVLPVVGFRWQINDQLLANFILPKPRLEYKLSDSLNVYVGGEVLSSTYRVDGDFGNRVNDERLNSAWVAYTELRVGAGVTIKRGPFSIDLEAGYMPYRELDFQRVDVVAHTDDTDGGIYGGVSVTAKF